MLYLSEINLSDVSQLFDIFGKMRLWNNLKNEFHLCENSYFTFMQLIDSTEGV